MANTKKNTVNKKNVLVGNFPIKSDAGSVKFPVGRDGKLTIGGKKCSADMNKDVDMVLRKKRR